MSVEALSRSVAGSMFHTCAEDPAKVEYFLNVFVRLIVCGVTLFKMASIKYYGMQ